MSLLHNLLPLLKHTFSLKQKIVIGQPTGLISLLLSCGFQRSNSVHQAWWQAPLPAELSSPDQKPFLKELPRNDQNCFSLSTLLYKRWDLKHLTILLRPLSDREETSQPPTSRALVPPGQTVNMLEVFIQHSCLFGFFLYFFFFF